MIECNKCGSEEFHIEEADQSSLNLYCVECGYIQVYYIE